MRPLIDKPIATRLAPGARLLVLVLLVVMLQPGPALVVPGPPQVVNTEYALLGVHTRLTDEVEPWKIKRTLEMVREMGAGWIVEFFPWAYYAASNGSYAWEHPDLVVEHAHAQGLRVVARIGLTPAWARPKDTPLTYLDETAFDDFAIFAAAFAARYKGKVEAIIVGNEPNLSFEWGYRRVAATEYVALLSRVYPAVKQANPQMLVLGGALAPTLEPEGSPWAYNDLTYLTEMYRAGAAAYLDALAVHAYGLTFPPEAAPDPTVLNFRRIELVRQVMVDNGDENTPIFVTESGWNDHPRWTKAVRPAQRIRYTLEAIRLAETNWPYVEMLAVWAFRYPAPANGYPDYFTLVSPEFVPKPIYWELMAFTGNGPSGDDQ